MKFIPPLEIASKIMTLIEEAEKTLIIVSPYVNIIKWDKMKKCLERAVKRGVNITFIARKNADMNLTVLSDIGITPILINDLHAKVYINDNYGIVTSLNMVHYSDINSIDIAYRTESIEERTEVLNFVDKYILRHSEIEKITKNRFSIVEETKKYRDLSSYEVEYLYNTFCYYFKDSKFRATATYLFSGSLFHFADVMIDATFTIKIKKSREDAEDIIKKICNMDSELNYQIYHYRTHAKFHYLEFLPEDNFDFKTLINDYISISRTIIDEIKFVPINTPISMPRIRD